MGLHIFDEYLFLILWSLIGSTLGFFAFSDLSHIPPSRRFGKALVSIGVGMFIALPIFTYLLEYSEMSPKFSMMLSGLGAFGLPDFILKHYPTLLRGVVFNKIGKHHEPPDNCK